MTAACARFAASATRVKSLRKGSVEGAFVWTGAGTMMAAEELGDCLVDEDDEEEALEAALKAEEEFMVIVVMVYLRSFESVWLLYVRAAMMKPKDRG